jgi:hypothetical protein
LPDAPMKPWMQLQLLNLLQIVRAAAPTGLLEARLSGAPTLAESMACGTAFWRTLQCAKELLQTEGVAVVYAPQKQQDFTHLIVWPDRQRCLQMRGRCDLPGWQAHLNRHIANVSLRNFHQYELFEPQGRSNVH